MTDGCIRAATPTRTMDGEKGTAASFSSPSRMTRRTISSTAAFEGAQTRMRVLLSRASPRTTGAAVGSSPNKPPRLPAHRCCLHRYSKLELNRHRRIPPELTRGAALRAGPVAGAGAALRGCEPRAVEVPLMQPLLQCDVTGQRCCSLCGRGGHDAVPLAHRAFEDRQKPQDGPAHRTESPLVSHQCCTH